MITQTIRVNLNQKDLETILAVQSDTLREIAFEFYATDAEEAVQLDPDEFTVKFNMLKPDNNFVMTTFTDGIIKLSDQMTAVTGTGYYCILLMQDDEVIYSGNGKIIINDHVIGTENIDSVSEADGYTFPDDFYTKDTPLAVLDDSSTSTTSTWSSNKINGEINTASTSAIVQLNAMKTGFDGVVYPSPVEMVQSCDEIILGAVSQHSNYIDIPLDFSISGSYMRGYGPSSTTIAIDSDPNGKRTDFISVLGYKKLTAKLYGSDTGYFWGIVFCDAEKNYLPSVSVHGSLDGTIDIPVGAAYVIASSYKSSGNDPTGYIHNGKTHTFNKDIAEITTTLSDVVDYMDGIKDNLVGWQRLTATQIVDGYIVRLSDKDPYASATSCYAKTLIPNGTDKLKVSGKSGNATYHYGLGAFYTSNDTLISEIPCESNTAYTDLEVSIPANAAYILVNFYGVKAYYTDVIGHGIIDIKKVDEELAKVQADTALLNDVEFQLFKKFGVCGDSLSVGHTASASGATYNRNIYFSWGQFMARRMGNICLNFGASGISAKTWMSNAYCYTRLVDPNNLCQTYIVALGANDTSMTLGSIADVNWADMTQNADTEYGWYARVINAIRTVSAEAPIFLMTLPYPRNSDTKIDDINDMIREFAADSHFNKTFLVDLDAYYDEYFSSGKLSKEIRNTGWHQTSLGYLYTSKVIHKALSATMAANAASFQDVFLLPVGNNNVLD